MNLNENFADIIKKLLNIVNTFVSHQKIIKLNATLLKVQIGT